MEVGRTLLDHADEKVVDLMWVHVPSAGSERPLLESRRCALFLRRISAFVVADICDHLPGTGLLEAPITTVHTPLRRVSIADALAAMARHAVRAARTERIKSADAEGRIVACETRAAVDVPAFARSMVDGYAVIAADVTGASANAPVRLAIAGSVLMGKPAHASVHRGQAVAVPTGGAMPEGATGVIKVEDIDVRDGIVTIFDATDCEDRITPAASDVRAHEVLFAAGRRLSPAAIGLLCAAGVAQVDVYRAPVVGVLVTGDELVPAHEPLAVGQIHESNGVAIIAALRALGFAARPYGIIPDERDLLETELRRALNDCDAVLISGGSSVGQRDHVPTVVAEAGEPGVVVHGVRAKPGRPVLLAMIGDQPVIGLPGNPVSALVMLEALARPVLMRMFGIDDKPKAFRAQLEKPLTTDASLEHRIPVQLLFGTSGLIARPLLGSSSQLHILAYADAVIVVPEGSGGLAAGAMVDAFPFSATRTP
jgi:molybdopterin molybdotransferase